MENRKINTDCVFYKKDKKGNGSCKLGANLGVCDHCKAYHK